MFDQCTWGGGGFEVILIIVLRLMGIKAFFKEHRTHSGHVENSNMKTRDGVKETRLTDWSLLSSPSSSRSISHAPIAEISIQIWNISSAPPTISSQIVPVLSAHQPSYFVRAKCKKMHYTSRLNIRITDQRVVSPQALRV